MDRVHRKHRLKHGEGQPQLKLETLPESLVVADGDYENLLLVDEAPQRLATRDPQKAEVVKLRYFAGLNHAEVAKALNLSQKTLQRCWQFANAWLCDDIERHRNGSN